MRASSFLILRRSAGSVDCTSWLVREKKYSFSASLERRPASMRSTRTRLALALRFCARRRTRVAVLNGNETLWRTDFPELLMLSILHHFAPKCTTGRSGGGGGSKERKSQKPHPYRSKGAAP